MDAISWYALGRTIGDAQSISEAIDAALLNHNLDPSAHSQDSEAITNHRDAASLDHAFGSVNYEHMAFDKVMIQSCFESVDGWIKNGNMYAGIFAAGLLTAGGSGDEARARAETSISTFKIDYSKNPFFQTTLWFYSNTNQHAYIACGLDPSDWDGDNFGFKVVNGNLYAWWTSDYVEHTSLISGITLTEQNVYRAYYNSSNDSLHFVVNGVEKYTTSTNLPIHSNGFMFVYYIKADEAQLKGLGLIDFMFQMDR
jgi:hypothetical protein